MVKSLLLFIIILRELLFLPCVFGFSPNINEKNNNKTELMMAASENDIKSIKGLITNGANVNDCSVHGTTALMFASESGNIEALKVLLDAGANVNAHEYYKDGCSTWPGLSGRDSFVTICDSFKEQTALIYAVSNNHKEAVILLIAFGADTSMSRYKYNTALDLALLKNQEDVAEIIRMKHFYRSIFDKAILENDLNKIKMLVKQYQSWSLSKVNPFQEHTLVVALNLLRWEIASYLIKEWEIDIEEYLIPQESILKNIIDMIDEFGPLGIVTEFLIYWNDIPQKYRDLQSCCEYVNVNYPNEFLSLMISDS